MYPTEEHFVGRILITLAVATAAAATLVGGGVAAQSAGFDLRLAAKNLQPLTGARYEVWVVYGSKKLSTGTFSIASDGQISGRLASPRDPAKADAIVVTIEPRPDRDRGPSGIVVLSGKPRAGGTALSFPQSLRGISGTYLLATPTDEDGTNETAGIWFLTPDLRASLRLPDAPAGWAWEGWGVTQQTPLTTGRFSKVTGADRSAPFSGPKGAPAFPGEDFLQRLPETVSPSVNLADGSSLVVISLEPELKGKDPTGSAPFSIKPLVGKVPAGAKDHKSYSLRRDLSGLPSGRVTFAK